GTARVWDVNNGGCTNIVHREATALTALALSGDGSSLMIADANQAMCFFELDWDLEVVAPPPLEVGDLRVYGDR
ncbi:MAG TPA: hypothetical protein VMT89_10855, partial [Candidatus Acidoferrales bacterium]|nr:hypothetical protein [Candidatus Acidoferrales bacterium]